MFFPKLCCLAISSIRYQIDHSINGYIGTRQGHPIIYVTHNPDNPKTTPTHKECHRISSKQGQLFMPQIENYTHLKHRLDDHLNQWYSHYNYAPPKYVMPYKSGRRLDYEFFENSPEDANPRPPKFPIVYKGKTYYSKNEVLAVIVSRNLGLQFKSEVPLEVNDNTTYCLDGLIGCEMADFSMYLEIMGMPDKPDYMQRNYQKIVDYSNTGLRQNQEILYIFVPNSYEFDSDNLEIQIMMSIERSLPEPEGWLEAVTAA